MNKIKGIFDELREENNYQELDNDLKDKFLENIDNPKNSEGKYLDAFGNIISFKGIFGLVKAGTKINLNKRQQTEIVACANDYKYFRRNYCKIVSKKGIQRPEPRNYQERLEDELITGDDIIIHFGRQSGKTVTVSSYLLWVSLFQHNKNIGIAANVQKLAVEVLDKIKKMYLELPIWMQPGINVWNKQSLELGNGIKILTSATNGDSFRGYSIHILYIDEAAFIRHSLWEDFADSVFPAQDSLAEKQTLISSTPSGLNHYYHLVEGARKGQNGYKVVECTWDEVPRWNKDGSLKKPNVFRQEQIAKNGEIFWNQNFGAEFIGSSHTLISGTKLKSISYTKDDDIIFNSLFKGLKIYEEPLPGHHYILTADPKQDGIDSIGLQVIDVTKLPFIQVAVAKLDESFVVIPSRIFDLGTYYNNAYLVQENNTEATLINLVVDQYDYQGEVFIERAKTGKLKRNLKGIRTTVRTKKLMCSFFKKFIEEDLLIIRDKQTLDEMFNFIEKTNGSYSAESGYTDDLVMSLMLVFAPFLSIENWEDFKGFNEFIKKTKEDREREEQNLVEFLDLSFNGDDDGTEAPFTEGAWDDAIEYCKQGIGDKDW